ncbi:aminotransferase [Azospirillum canadense]|uniref:aminotransferase n=1 Tax=Azospirillum canadense TaxID=403962 RepID=UPI00222640C0|nr:aminotransferase [Azospirillum canadense]MCW2236779.1 aspartate/methionine/tyrosine aminotransferase [Azospirillum canadense]
MDRRDVNPLVTATEAPPIAEAWRWVEGRVFPADKPLIDLCQAVPGYPPADALTTYLAEQVKAPDTARYTGIDGVPALCAALAKRTSDLYGATVAANEVLITAGCNQAFAVAAMSLARAGENIILPAPWYFNHKMTLDMLGIEARPLPLRESDGLVPDPAEAEKLIDANTRALVLITPNNPTGAIAPPKAIAALYELCERRGIRLLLDETYRDFPEWGGQAPHGLFRRSGWQKTLVQLYSFSKVYSLAGYRVGAVIADAALLTHARKVMDCLAICAPHIGQKAALFGLENLDDWVAGKRADILARVNAFQGAMEESGTAYRIASIGAYFAYVRHPFGDRRAHDVAEMLARDHNILCLPGSMFGPGQDTYLRFAFANVDAAVMPEIGRRLVDSERS